MRYYIYILLDPRYVGDFSNRFCEIKNKPFYVGKGNKYCKSGSIRHLQHYKDVLKDNIIIKKNNPHKFNLIKKLYSLNYEPLFKIIYESDDENCWDFGNFANNENYDDDDEDDFDFDDWVNNEKQEMYEELDTY